MTSRPQISVVVVVHDMAREAPRTLESLSASCQRGLDPSDYEVLVMDNGSRPPLGAAVVRLWGSNFRYAYLDDAAPSPVAAINLGVELARGEHVAVCIDGARLLSPGMIGKFLAVLRRHGGAFAYSLSFHLGAQPQQLSINQGYSRETEDRLLRTISWAENGYRLFSVSCLALSSENGWRGPIAESNCFALSKRHYEALGGFDEGFRSPGGGLANLDFFTRALEHPELIPVLLAGEGTFHQIHSGVATNAPPGQEPWDGFHAEYRSLRGRDYAMPTRRPLYFGSVAPEAKPFFSGLDSIPDDLVPEAGVPADEP